MKPEIIEIVRPEPYYKIEFRCSNKNFYNVKSELWDMWSKSGIPDDFNNGYYFETCDYEGDLESIKIYLSEDPASHHYHKKLEPFINRVLAEYGGNRDDLGNMNLVLSIF